MVEYLVEVWPEGVLVRDKNGDTPLDLAKMPVHGKPVAELIHYLELVEERMELETSTAHSNYDSNYDSQDDDMSQELIDEHYDSKAYDARSYGSRSFDSRSYDSESDSEVSSDYEPSKQIV